MLLPLQPAHGRDEKLQFRKLLLDEFEFAAEFPVEEVLLLGGVHEVPERVDVGGCPPTVVGRRHREPQLRAVAVEGDDVEVARRRVDARRKALKVRGLDRRGEAHRVDVFRKAVAGLTLQDGAALEEVRERLQVVRFGFHFRVVRKVRFQGTLNVDVRVGGVAGNFRNGEHAGTRRTVELRAGGLRRLRGLLHVFGAAGHALHAAHAGTAGGGLSAADLPEGARAETKRAGGKEYGRE